MKHRYFLNIAFRGSQYHGWQKQMHAISVQEVMATHISTILREELNVHGCGRTDAGVHARKFMLHFDSTQKLNAEFARNLNSFLPKDIAVRAMYKNTEKIHARYDALNRTYEYLITNKKHPFMIDQVATYYGEYDIDFLNKACEILLKYEDFESFSKTNNNHKHYLCSLEEAFWQKEEDILRFRITANRFVRSMVRLIVGTLLMVGEKKIDTEDFRKIIESKDRTKAGKSAPACGLYLVDVQYPEGRLKQVF